MGSGLWDPCSRRSFRDAKVVVDHSVMGKLSQYVEETSSGAGELCGGLNVSYNPFYGYLVWGIVRGEIDHGGAHCVPNTAGLQGIWHTHPKGLCRASGIDMATMRRDAERSIEAVIPGVPPLNMIAASGSEGVCVKSYIPSWSASCRTISGPHAYIVEEAGPAFRGASWGMYRLIEVEEKEDPMEGGSYYAVRIKGDLDAEEANGLSGMAGVYLAHSVPPHASATVLEFARRRIGGRLWLLDDLAGLYLVEASQGFPVVEEVEVSVASTGLGWSERMSLLESEYGFPVSSIGKSTVALFGAGFIGSRIAEVVAPYVGRLIVVDYDFVGEENIGYQSLYSLQGLDAEKASVLTRELLARHSKLRVVPVRHRVPDGRSAPSSVVWSVVESADVVVTAFDSMGPRLNVQLAASGLGKPLIDASVGLDEGVVWTWIPGGGSACIGCYLSGSAAYDATSNTYASHPVLAWMTASIAGWKAVLVASGRGGGGDVLRVSLGGDGVPRVRREVIVEDKGCPYHSGKVRLSLKSELRGVSLRVELDEEPWMPVSRVLERLESILKGRWVLSGGDGGIPGYYSVAWAYRMESMGRQELELVISGSE